MISEWLKDTQERLLAPIKIWMNSNPLRWMRLVMLLILLFWLSWFFTDFQIYTMFFGILPFCYLLTWNSYLPKQISILILVTILNLAFWIPHYYSYLLIRTILVAEQIKLVCCIGLYLLTIPIVLILSYGHRMDYTIALFATMYLLFYGNKKMLEILKNDDFKKQFKIGGISETDEELIIRKMVVILYIAICFVYYI